MGRGRKRKGTVQVPRKTPQTYSSCQHPRAGFKFGQVGTGAGWGAGNRNANYVIT